MGRKDYTILEWDSELFGFGVARIDAKECTQEQLAMIRSELKAYSVRLAYWNIEPSDMISARTATQIGAYRADEKVTYTVDLSKLIIVDCDYKIKPYTCNTPMAIMEKLSIQSGMYSRFALDKQIPLEKFETLYKVWIQKSVKKKIAKEVLLSKDGAKVNGMITLGGKGAIGDIGLVAVDHEARGKGIGKMLVQAALNWFFRNKYDMCQVVTQKANKPACRLYEACGFSIKQTDKIYHIWL